MHLIYPMFAMVLLTAVVGVLTAYNRIKGAYAGKVDARYFKLMSGYPVPDKIAQLGRNFNNLMEVPMLFYAAGATALALNIASTSLVVLAWAFVGLRIVHSVIHLTYNHPLHRFLPFIASFICVLFMWGYLVMVVAAR